MQEGQVVIPSGYQPKGPAENVSVPTHIDLGSPAELSVMQEQLKAEIGSVRGVAKDLTDKFDTLRNRCNNILEMGPALNAANENLLNLIKQVADKAGYEALKNADGSYTVEKKKAAKKTKK